MNQKSKEWLVLVISLFLGIILHRFIPMLYFVGFILAFIMIMGQNQLDLRQNEQGKVNHFINRRLLFYAIGGYLIAGILILFMQ